MAPRDGGWARERREHPEKGREGRRGGEREERRRPDRVCLLNGVPLLADAGRVVPGHLDRLGPAGPVDIPQHTPAVPQVRNPHAVRLDIEVPVGRYAASQRHAACLSRARAASCMRGVAVHSCVGSRQRAQLSVNCTQRTSRRSTSPQTVPPSSGASGTALCTPGQAPGKPAGQPLTIESPHPATPHPAVASAQRGGMGTALRGWSVAATHLLERGLRVLCPLEELLELCPANLPEVARGLRSAMAVIDPAVDEAIALDYLTRRIRRGQLPLRQALVRATRGPKRPSAGKTGCLCWGGLLRSLAPVKAAQAALLREPAGPPPRGVVVASLIVAGPARCGSREMRVIK